MKRTGWCFLLLLFVFGLLVPQPIFARALDAKDKQQIECAMFKMWVLGNYFDVKKTDEQKQYKYPAVCGASLRDKPISMPKWFPEELKRMEDVKVVYVEGDGTLSEATLWYRTFSNVYAYLSRAADSLDPSKPVVLEQLSRGYVGNRINLVANLDRLNKDLVRGRDFLSLKDSMEGRARSMLATLEFMNREFYSTIESFVSPASEKENKYRQSVMAVVTLSNQLWREFRGDPLPMNPPDASIYKTTEGERLFTALMIVLGALLLGGAVYLLLENKKEFILEKWDDYRQKRNLTSHTYNENAAKEVVSIIEDFANEAQYLLDRLKEKNN